MASPLAVQQPWNLVASAYTIGVVPTFEHYSRRALELAALPHEARVVDVACGPGTLSFLAAAAGAHVSAIDFSPGMLAELEAVRASKGAVNVDARLGDGMALPYPDGSFEAAFSMFGLMFFPDRAKGFSELHRVLVPGGRAVVSSWHPLDQVPVLGTIFGTIAEMFPPPPGPPPTFPLAAREECIAEMRAAGFHDVAVHTTENAFESPSMDAMWESFQETNAPLVLLREKVGPAYPAFATKVLATLKARFGEGPQRIAMPAWLTVGVR